MTLAAHIGNDLAALDEPLRFAWWAARPGSAVHRPIGFLPDLQDAPTFGNFDAFHIACNGSRALSRA